MKTKAVLLAALLLTAFNLTPARAGIGGWWPDKAEVTVYPYLSEWTGEQWYFIAWTAPNKHQEFTIDLELQFPGGPWFKALETPWIARRDEGDLWWIWLPEFTEGNARIVLTPVTGNGQKAGESLTVDYP